MFTYLNALNTSIYIYTRSPVTTETKPVKKISCLGYDRRFVIYVAMAELKVNCLHTNPQSFKGQLAFWQTKEEEKKKYNFNQINVLYALFLTSDQHKNDRSAFQHITTKWFQTVILCSLSRQGGNRAAWQTPSKVGPINLCCTRASSNLLMKLSTHLLKAQFYLLYMPYTHILVTVCPTCTVKMWHFH